KWDSIAMDFVSGLPKTSKGHAGRGLCGTDRETAWNSVKYCIG
ncbi:hypothetical protein A2U01_0107201, partial [Trifolium medium]|nr:hypothetical protein [Trifolium medium]